jgi:hypothetical protein
MSEELGSYYQQTEKFFLPSVQRGSGALPAFYSMDSKRSSSGVRVSGK